MSALLPFEFEGAAMRVLSRDGAPWFILADLCRVLGLANVAMAARRLDDDERIDGVSIVDLMGRSQKATAVNESGMWSLVLTSRKPAARRFKRWVTGTVLPALRRDGAYVVGQDHRSAEHDLPGRGFVVGEACVLEEVLGRLDRLERRMASEPAPIPAPVMAATYVPPQPGRVGGTGGWRDAVMELALAQKVSGARKTVLLVLARRCAVTRCCRISQSELAGLCGLSERTVERALRDLVAGGLIRTIRRAGEASIYQLFP